jgi:preprotein translocase subunit SecE
VARDRKRAKQRRSRRGAATTARGSGRAPAAPPSQPTRADVPGSLDHASGEVDEFDAALVRGAGGVTASPETGLQEGAGAQDEADLEDQAAAPDQAALQDETGLRDGAPAAADEELEDLEDLEDLEAPPPPGAGGGGVRDGAGGDGRAAAGEHERPAEAPLRLAQRAVAFLQASWAELQRVHWPDRRGVAQATAVVICFVAIAGAYLGLADYLAKEIVEFVL